ncbi:hypothetical protein [Photobacterium sp. DNB22_13_2]
MPDRDAEETEQGQLTWVHHYSGGSNDMGTSCFGRWAYHDDGDASAIPY